VPPVLPFRAKLLPSRFANFMALISSSSTIRLYDLISKLISLLLASNTIFFVFLAQTGFVDSV
jgi:hypothetical protein